MPPGPNDCPPGWHAPPRSPPRPGQNPAWDELEAQRLRYEKLFCEAETSLGYHDLRVLGLAAARNAYRDGLELIAQKQAALLAASK